MTAHDQYCRECGTSIPAGAANCPKCGSPVAQKTEASTRLSIDTSRLGQTKSMAGDSMTSKIGNQPSKYQIADGFVLNTETGDVWKFDEGSGKFKVVEKEDSLLTSADKAKIYFDRSEDFAQLANLDLQTRQQRQQEVIQTLSNVSKMMHDTAKGIIRNLK